MKYYVLIGLVLVAVLVSGCVSGDNQPGNNETLYVSLGQEFILHENQSAILNSDDFEISVIEFIYAPCPEGMQCAWSGLGIVFEYRHDDEVKGGLNLVQAFDYQINIIDTDYQTYAKLNITRL